MPNTNYHYVYVLQSDIDRNFYVGYTTNLINRLRQYNSRRVISTRMRLPVRLVYWEGCLSQKDATTREKYLKTAWGKRYIKNRLKDYLTG
jgi:putative endonuclease